MASSEAMSAADYIKHHLQSLTSLSDVTQGQGLKNIADFSYINLDAVFFAVLLGALGSFLLWRAARKATPGVPGRFQAAVELLFNVEVTGVSVVNIKGKVKRSARGVGRRNNVRKAYVMLREGSELNLSGEVA